MAKPNVPKGNLIRLAIALCAAWPGSAIACLPPPVSQTPAPSPAQGESDADYFDRIANMQDGSTYFDPPPPSGPESPEAYKARVATFRTGLAQAAQRREARRAEQARLAEYRRWQDAGQIVLVEARGVYQVRRGDRQWTETRFRIIARERGTERFREARLRYPTFTTDCGPFYPQFNKHERYVMLAKPGPLDADSLIAYYRRDDQPINERANAVFERNEKRR